MKTDALGNELKKGQTILFMEIGYRSFKLGRIKKVNEKKVTVYTRGGRQTQQFHNQVIVINPNSYIQHPDGWPKYPLVKRQLKFLDFRGTEILIGDKVCFVDLKADGLSYQSNLLEGQVVEIDYDKPDIVGIKSPWREQTVYVHCSNIFIGELLGLSFDENDYIIFADRDGKLHEGVVVHPDMIRYDTSYKVPCMQVKPLNSDGICIVDKDKAVHGNQICPQKE